MKKFLVTWTLKQSNHMMLQSYNSNTGVAIQPPDSEQTELEQEGGNFNTFDDAKSYAENIACIPQNSNVQIVEMTSRKTWNVKPLPRVEITRE